MLLKEINEDYSGSKAHRLIFDVLTQIRLQKTIGLHDIAIELSGSLISVGNRSNYCFNTSLSLLQQQDAATYLKFCEFEILDYENSDDKIKISKYDNDYLATALGYLQKFKPIQKQFDEFWIEVKSGEDCYDQLIDIMNCLMDNQLIPFLLHSNIDFGTLITKNDYEIQFTLFEIAQNIIEFNLTNLDTHIVNQTNIKFNEEIVKANIRLCYTSIDECILVVNFKDNLEFQKQICQVLEYEEYDVYHNHFADIRGEIQVTIHPKSDEDMHPMIYEILDKIT